MTKIVFISDTHNLHYKLDGYMPKGDILIHCGDMTTNGTREEYFSFFRWFSQLDYEHKIYIAGNHDRCLDFNKHYNGIKLVTGEDMRIAHDYWNTIYLNNMSCKINEINFFGSPYTSIFGNFAFMQNDEQLKETHSLIPDNVDILITHGPPLNTLDLTTGYEPAGSKSLFERVKEVKPRIHVFGHIHEGYGMKEIDGTIFINAANHEWLWKGGKPKPPITVNIDEDGKCTIL